MHACCSCADPAAADSAAGPQQGPARARPGRFRAAVEWATPITALALVPKCPACVAGYALLLTGLGLSFRAAAIARWSVIAISIAALAYLLLRTVLRAAIRTLRDSEGPGG